MHRDGRVHVAFSTKSTTRHDARCARIPRLQRDQLSGAADQGDHADDRYRHEPRGVPLQAVALRCGEHLTPASYTFGEYNRAVSAKGLSMRRHVPVRFLAAALAATSLIAVPLATSASAAVPAVTCGAGKIVFSTKTFTA